MDDPARIGDELMHSTAALRRVVRRRLRPGIPGPGLRGAQIELLRAVEEEPGIGVAAAAKTLRLAPNSVSTLVNQLLEDGMLTRRTDPGDRRAAQLYLTDAAARRIATWRRARSELVGDALANLSTKDVNALEKALPALRALVAHLDDEDDLREAR